MNLIYEEFIKYLEAEDKERSLGFIMSKLKSGEIDIYTLYNDVLAPSLNSMVPSEGKGLFIWREHVRSSIVRSIIENCYPYVIGERDKKYGMHSSKTVAVVCPSEEYHEIGARMISDYFTLLGYHSVFVGSNTPTEEFLSALEAIHLDYIALSISNYYNLVTADKIIELIRGSKHSVKIIVGGSAFDNNTEVLEHLNADIYLKTFDDIKKLAKEDKS